MEESTGVIQTFVIQTFRMVDVGKESLDQTGSTEEKTDTAVGQ